MAIADSENWLNECEYQRVVQAFKEKSSYRIHWVPMSSQAKFIFQTHQHLKNFLRRFLTATNVFAADQNLSPAHNSRDLVKDFNLPTNAITGWIFIERMHDVLT